MYVVNIIKLAEFSTKHVLCDVMRVDDSSSRIALAALELASIYYKPGPACVNIELALLERGENDKVLASE